MTSPQAGWYQDPQNAQFLRYWNGTEWTEQTQPQAATLQAPQPLTPRHIAPERTSWAAAPVSFVEAAEPVLEALDTRSRIAQ